MDDKRRDQEIQLNVELCKLKRKHIIMFHKLQCEIDTIVSEIYFYIFVDSRPFKQDCFELNFETSLIFN